MPKSFSKKSTDISFPGDQLKSYKILFSLSQTEPLFDIRIGQGGQKADLFLEKPIARQDAHRNNKHKKFH